MKPIPEYPGYFASDTGHIFSNLSGQMRPLATQLKHGYLYVDVQTGPAGARESVTQRVHKLVLLAWAGPKPTPDHECRHLDGNRTNNAPTNLVWGTRTENYQDAIAHGTAAVYRFGDYHASSKLDTEKVKDIVARIGSGECDRTIAMSHGVAKRTINNIRRGESWKHVPREMRKAA